MKRFSGSIIDSEKGFTLIELLIVIAILGVLAAVAIPNVSKFIGAGKTQTAATELSTVQSAVQSMMVNKGLTALPVNELFNAGNATNGMSIFPAAHYALYPDYMMSANSTYKYYCGTAGNVTQANPP